MTLAPFLYPFFVEVEYHAYHARHRGIWRPSLALVADNISACQREDMDSHARHARMCRLMSAHLTFDMCAYDA